MATVPCSFCKGDHTEVKCPHLDGYVKHMLSVINISAYTLDDVHSDPYTIAHRFTQKATTTELLNFQTYTWYTIARSYSKKMNYKLAGLKRRGKKRKRSIKCGYCGHRGHTRRTCAVMKKHIDVIEKSSKIYRDEFLTACELNGIGIGSIVKLTLSERGREYQGYWGDLPDTMMAMITHLPVLELSPFVNEPAWASISYQAFIKLKLIAPTKRYSALTTYDAAICRNMFNGAFSSFLTVGSSTGLSAQYDFTIIGKSSNLNYDETLDKPYLEIFKKHDEYTIGRYVGQAAAWLKEKSS
jgi:hypothetical protein